MAMHDGKTDCMRLKEMMVFCLHI